MRKDFIMRPLFPQIPDPSMLEVDQLLRPHYQLLWRIIMEPWQDFHDRRADDKWFQDYSEPDAAFLMHTHIKNHARNLITDQHAIKIHQLFGKPVYLLPEQLAITVKKLRRIDEDELFRSNYLTKRNQNFWDQRKTEGYLDVPRVILGYVFLAEMTKIEIIVAYPRTRGLEVQWYYEMPAQSDAPLRLVDIEAEAEPEKEFKIVPRKAIIISDEDVEGA